MALCVQDLLLLVRLLLHLVLLRLRRLLLLLLLHLVLRRLLRLLLRLLRLRLLRLRMRLRLLELRLLRLMRLMIILLEAVLLLGPLVLLALLREHLGRGLLRARPWTRRTMTTTVGSVAVRALPAVLLPRVANANCELVEAVLQRVAVGIVGLRGGGAHTGAGWARSRMVRWHLSGV